jgi:hypothetical protein
VRPVLQLEAQIITNGLRRAQRGAAVEPLAQRAPGYLKRGLELDVFRRAEAGRCSERSDVGRQERRKRAEAAKVFARKIHCAPALDTGAQEYRHQLRVGQGFDTLPQDFLAWPIILWPVGDCHDPVIGKRLTVNGPLNNALARCAVYRTVTFSLFTVHRLPFTAFAVKLLQLIP